MVIFIAFLEVKGENPNNFFVFNCTQGIMLSEFVKKTLPNSTKFQCCSHDSKDLQNSFCSAPWLQLTGLLYTVPLKCRQRRVRTAQGKQSYHYLINRHEEKKRSTPSNDSLISLNSITHTNTRFFDLVVSVHHLQFSEDLRAFFAIFFTQIRSQHVGCKVINFQ